MRSSLSAFGRILKKVLREFRESFEVLDEPKKEEFFLQKIFPSFDPENLKTDEN